MFWGDKTLNTFLHDVDNDLNLAFFDFFAASQLTQKGIYSDADWKRIADNEYRLVTKKLSEQEKALYETQSDAQKALLEKLGIPETYTVDGKTCNVYCVYHPKNQTVDLYSECSVKKGEAPDAQTVSFKIHEQEGTIVLETQQVLDTLQEFRNQRPELSEKISPVLQRLLERTGNNRVKSWVDRSHENPSNGWSLGS